MLRHLRAILLLPGIAAGVVPAGLLWLTGARIEPWTAVVGGLVFVLGLGLVVWTVHLFATIGRGTLAPWDPTSRLVVRGPYRWVRNPMITGVATVLAGEALFFRSFAIAIELGLFVAVNAVYFPLVEEPGLVRRFGSEYEDYRAAVPRWIPRLWRRC